MRVVSTAIVPVLLLALWTSPSIAAGLTGTVLVTGTLPKPKKLDVVIDQFACGTEKDAGDLVLSPRKELANAVVWIENAPDNAAAPHDEKVEVDQKACVFVPRVVVVPAKGTVFFLNSDKLLHNIHTTPKINAEFTRTQPKNRSIPLTFDKPEIVRIACDLHPWMTAWVVVAAHPYYAVTGTDGQFAFDVPPGQYKLKVWHERLGTVETSATVGDKASRLTVEMQAR